MLGQTEKSLENKNTSTDLITVVEHSDITFNEINRFVSLVMFDGGWDDLHADVFNFTSDQTSLEMSGAL